MDAHRLAEERSLEYHRAVAERLLREPELVDVARDRVRTWIASGQPAAYYARSWEERLFGSVGEVAAFIVEDSETGRALRQVTPFAGFIDPRERWRIWREVRARYEAQR